MKTMLTFFAMMIFLSLTQAQNKNAKEYNLVIGTYTNQDKTNGIHVYRFNTENGEFSERSKATNINNPSYLAISKDGKNIYSVSEERGGKVNAFNFNPASGELTFINSAGAGGNGSCYVSVDSKKKLAFVGNYGGGSLSAVRVKEDGSMSDDVQTIAHEGSSVNTERQEKPHVHAVVLSPDERYLLVPDLGTDKVHIYSIDASKGTQPLTALEPAGVKPGSGPRHLTFHPNGKFAYLVQELDAMVTAFDYKNGTLKAKQSITMLAPDFKETFSAADIHVSPDGKFLYGSNRGDANEIVIYAIDKNGKLSYAGRQSTLGKTPRNFVIDPTGNFLLVANQNTNDIFIFRRDQKTGLLTDSGKKIGIDRPVCLKFAAIN